MPSREFPVATTPAPGIQSVDWEERVKWDRLKEYRTAFWDLDGPVLRITTPHVPLPPADLLEDATVQSVERISAEIRAGWG